MQSTEKITLFELNQKIKEVLSRTLQLSFWVIAEISEIKENSSGHCYLELIQKDDQQDYPKAKARATIWAYTYRMLKPYFETTTGRPLSSGLKVLVLADIVFHEVYGYSLNIVDIEPNYTLGDIEQKRREAIEKLIQDGIFDMNKGLQIPILPKKVAVISSTSAAGLQDFVNQIESNQFGYKIEYQLFPALMQGDAAENSIITALNQIFEHQNQFDIVVIIRGGGSQADLSCFDSYWMAAHVAQFPLPVITGIGHEKDTSVVDLVAHTKLKTPTAVSEFIIDKFAEADTIANDLKERLEQVIEDIIIDYNYQLEKIITTVTPLLLEKTSNEKFQIEKFKSKIYYALSQLFYTNSSNLERYLKSFEYLTLLKISNTNNRINTLKDFLLSKTKYQIEKQINHIDNKTNTLNSLNPINVLNRGYSITMYKGKTLTNTSKVAKGEEIKSILKEGEITSRVL
ncbi:MAG: exodeoxyribonuclease VII large subunit [Tenuifilaceae bacterium]